jgi:hypothetical protein
MKFIPETRRAHWFWNLSVYYENVDPKNRAEYYQSVKVRSAAQA